VDVGLWTTLQGFGVNQASGGTVYATGTLTLIGSNTVGSIVTIGGKALREGIEWTAGITPESNAENISIAINFYTDDTSCNSVVLVGSETVVRITANTVGVAGNSIGLVTNPAIGDIVRSGATLTGGA